MLDAMDFEHRYRAVRTRDPRFDGYFFTAVTSTRIYCRPSCPAITPRRSNLRFYPTAAAAQSAGFRACKRCRPDATPGSPEWNHRADLVGRAMRLIADGIVDREGVGGLAGRLGYSERHVARELRAEVGAGPLALARAQRAQSARVLLETTDLPVTEVAFAAGFASVRQFNGSIRAVFAASPRELRRASRAERSPQTSLSIRLPYRAPLGFEILFRFLATRCVAGVEAFEDGAYLRSLRLPHGPGILELRPREGHVECELRLADWRDLNPAVGRARRLLDLDADPRGVHEVLAADPALGPLVRARPGLRLPGTVDGFELAVRAVLGQRISVAAARTLAGRVAAAHGEALKEPRGRVTLLFPDAPALAEADLAEVPMTGRRDLVRALAALVAGGELDLDPGADRGAVFEQLMALPGVGRWTASYYITMRALGDPDVLLTSDLGVRRAARRLGLPSTPRALGDLSQRWRPWRSYATCYLWDSLSHFDPPTLSERSVRPTRRRTT